jgi:hypothetical protein
VCAPWGCPESLVLWAVMSLFDAVHVTPPGPCSRCGERVPATSLFCPQCGQSMLRPKPHDTTAEVAPSPNETPEPAPAIEDSASQASTTGWLRRSLNLGKKPLEEPTAESPPTQELEATQQMSLFDIEQAEAVAQKKSTKRPAAGVRFVLAFSDGTQVTIGDRPGVIGVKPIVEGEEVLRVCVEDPSDTVAPEHLEFGVDQGVLWVQDLKTVNGTIVHEPGSPPIQCIPYEKYFVVRGSTVTVGELSFTLN